MANLFTNNLETIMFALTILFAILAVLIAYMLLTKRSGSKNVKDAYEKNTNEIVNVLWSSSFINKTKTNLKTSGRKISAEKYIFTKFLISTVVSVAILMFTLDVIATAIAALLINVSIKYFVITARINAKRKKIEKSVLPFFETLSLAVQSGAGLEKAIELTCTHIDDSILVEEFKRVLADARYGLSMEEALFALIDRMPSQIIASTISAIINALEIGAPMSKTLKSEILRIRQILVDKAEESAAKSGQRIVIPLVLTMLPSLIILLAGPAVLRAITAFLLGW